MFLIKELASIFKVNSRIGQVIETGPQAANNPLSLMPMSG
jgi:hypothetical protein